MFIHCFPFLFRSHSFIENHPPIDPIHPISHYLSLADLLFLLFHLSIMGNPPLFLPSFEASDL